MLSIFIDLVDKIWLALGYGGLIMLIVFSVDFQGCHINIGKCT